MKRKASALPALGKAVHYCGKVWTVDGLEKDEATFGYFVDLVRTDSEGKYQARLHTAHMVPDTTGGHTHIEDRPMTGSRHGGDPRYPLTPEFIDRHQRFNQLIEQAAINIFKHSRWKSPGGWESLDEARRAQLRQLARATWVGGQAPKSPPGVTKAVLSKHAAPPPDLQEWLDQNG